jgi:hypothetical protein
MADQQHKQQYKWPEIHGRSLYDQDDRPHRWELTREVKWNLSNGDEITIPSGYTTDFASVPRMFRGIVWGTGKHNLAVLIHDWLYDNQLYSRKFADDEMLFWIKARGCTKIKAYTMYWICRLGGGKWWERESKPYLTPITQ